jgi:membrane dipeptidase
MVLDARRELRARHPEPADFARAFEAWFETHRIPRGTVADVVDHIDYMVKVAGIDHVGLGGDFDGVTSVPVGLEDVSGYPRITDELLKRGYSEANIHKILGGNALRALRDAGRIAAELRKTTKPEVDQPKDAPNA